MRRANQLVGLTPTFYIFERGKRKPELERFAWKRTPKEKTRRNTESTELRSTEAAEGMERVRHRALAMSGRVEGAERVWHIAYRGSERTHLGHHIHFFIWVGNWQLPECLH